MKPSLKELILSVSPLCSPAWEVSLPLGLFGRVAIEKDGEKAPKTRLETDDAAPTARARPG